MLARTSVEQRGQTFDAVESAAKAALFLELACYPKPGLVSFVDTGSHTDMNAVTFLRSIAALTGYFREIAAAGADDLDFLALKRIGQAAERRMFQATGGINTHRGAVFSLGLLAAAAGREYALGRTATASSVCGWVAERWGPDIRASVADHSSHGAEVRRRYGAIGAREEAAAGFPTVMAHTLPAYRLARRRGANQEEAALQAFFTSVSILEDNNLLYRGGFEGLEWARTTASEFLSAGGILAPDGRRRALSIHKDFVARRLSPGGSADLLAATLFLFGLEQGNEGGGSNAWA